MHKKEKILIIGAGLCGSLLALRLAQKGYQVDLREGRGDLRKEEQSAGRSINLAYSNRGIAAMDMIGLTEKVKALCIPMKGRMIHHLSGDVFFSPYSGRKNDYINSVSRADLNGLLLDEVSNHELITLSFNNSCSAVDLKNKKATFKDVDDKEVVVSYDIVFGADGAGSVLRKIMDYSVDSDLEAETSFLKHAYKELTIPAGANQSFQMQKEALHIWPRGKYMLIALPNIGGSYTVTLFLPHNGEEYSFEALDTKEKVILFFNKQFADAVALMPNLASEFFENSTGNLGTVKCFPWNYQDSAMLIGDAAHAIVPFYGQGMNASFEDVLILDKYIDLHKGDWSMIFTSYTSERKKDTDAIADLAIENFYEMRDHVANESFKEKRSMELVLEANYDYSSKYSMVTFKNEIPYHQAKTKGNAQDKFLLEMIYKQELETLSSEEIFKVLSEKTKNIK